MRTLVALFVILCSLAGTTAAAPFKSEAPEEQRVRTLAAQLRCPVCQSENILDSQSTTAREMVVILREQITGGKTDTEIVEYFRSRYGDYVLLEPPANRTGLPIWIVPVALLIVGSVITTVLLRAGIKREKQKSDQDDSIEPLDEEQLERLSL